MFNQKKNKKFSYTSRFSKDESNDSETKLDIKRDEVSSPLQSTRKTGSNRNRKSRLLFLLLLLGTIIAIMYYLEYKIN